MPSDDLRGTMERVGERFNLGEYEIDAYLTVLEHGQLTASEIADRTEIPQPRVYDTVRSLSDRSLVELRESRPMKIIAVDPDDAFSDLESSLSELEYLYLPVSQDRRVCRDHIGQIVVFEISFFPNTFSIST